MITDFHTHIFPPSASVERERWLRYDDTFRELYTNPKAKLESAEELIVAMDEDGVGGVGRSVSMGMGWTDPGVAREANDYIIESASKYPDRIVGFCSVNPVWGDVAAQEVERCAKLGAARDRRASSRHAGLRHR